MYKKFIDCCCCCFALLYQSKTKKWKAKQSENIIMQIRYIPIVLYYCWCCCFFAIIFSLLRNHEFDIKKTCNSSTCVLLNKNSMNFQLFLFGSTIFFFFWSTMEFPERNFPLTILISTQLNTNNKYHLINILKSDTIARGTILSGCFNHSTKISCDPILIIFGSMQKICEINQNLIKCFATQLKFIWSHAISICTIHSHTIWGPSRGFLPKIKKFQIFCKIQHL